MLGVVVAGAQYLQGGSEDGALSHLLLQASYPMLWWLLSPAIGRIDAALHSRVRWPLQVLLHAAAGSVLGAAHSAITWALGAATGTLSARVLAWGPQAVVVSWWPINLLVYGMILGAWIALRYYRELRLREVEASRLAADLATARLQALRMQLNPHFLFNTMNTIAMLVRAQENDRAVQMLAGFSDLLRTVLVSREDEFTRLEDEVRLAERYLAIERVRFADRLAITVDVPAALHEVPVPALLLQPLVENAVRHGISRRTGGGTIRLSARRCDTLLEVEVRNDGRGGESDAEAGTGLGLATTRERLRRRYGERGQLDFETTPGGAVVRVRLPLDESAA